MTYWILLPGTVLSDNNEIASLTPACAKSAVSKAASRFRFLKSIIFENASGTAVLETIIFAL